MGSAVREAIEAGPAPPAGRQAAWCLTRIQTRGASASLADLDHFVPTLAERMRRRRQ